MVVGGRFGKSDAISIKHKDTHNMQQLKNFADPRLIQGCIYCGAPNPDTREHVPSKVLLEKPFPENLPVIGACRSCNNSYSIDEEYAACIIACMSVGSTKPDEIKNSRVRDILSKKTYLRFMIEQSKVISSGTHSGVSFNVDQERFNKFINKLAIGHAAYELSLILHETPRRLEWKLISSMSEDEITSFDAPQLIDILGEIGSRDSQRAIVVEALLQSPSTGEMKKIPFILNDWIDVQDGVYRYHVAQNNDSVTVKIVLS